MSERSLRREHQRRLDGTERRRARRARRAGLAATAAVGAIGIFAPSAQAASFEVNTLSDHAPDGSCDAAPDCTLREAVLAANTNAQNDTITFLSGLTGTINLQSGQIQINDANGVDIQGPGTGVITVSGDKTGDGPSADDSRVFYVADLPGNGDTSISGLTVTGGYASSGGGGAISTDAGSGPYSETHTYLDHVSITGSQTTTGNGGGVYAQGSLTISHSTISGNQAPSSGPGGNGGAIDAQKYLGIDNSTISGNVATYQGGGISHSGKYGMQISDSVISGNSAAEGGGFEYRALTPFKYSHTDITGTTIKGNSATDYGAGGAIGRINGGNQITISHSTLSGNNGPVYGGGLAFTGTIYGSVQTVDSTISGNSAATGGGVALGPCGCAIPGGDRLVGPKGSVSFDNSTISSNTASTAGGGIYLGQYYASSPPYYSATIPLNSTIVADNTAAGAKQDLDRGNNSTNGGFDLAFSLVEAPGDAPLTKTASIIGADPKLGGLADNGGPTLTQLPADTSPVIDQGHAPADLKTDQRGKERTVETPIPNAPGGDGTDIGSIELASVPVGPQTELKAGQNRKPKKVKTRKKFKKFRVNFGADQPGAKFQCKVDNGDFAPCTSPFTARLRSGRGKGRLHQITIQAVDASGKATGPPFAFFVRVVRLPHR
jgi:CSLREA domain-containing protein